LVATRILFVDDEPGIRLTLAPILERHGFEVATAASVAEALTLINRQPFDVLLADLNIGEPGDGFTVVSAMRRLQPEARTFILTGYPDFESALQAIRGQVDDYLLKPTDVPTLLHAIRSRLEQRPRRAAQAPMKRVPELLRENREEIVGSWLREAESHPELRQLAQKEEQRAAYLRDLIDLVADRVQSGTQHFPEVTEALGAAYGRRRAEQGYQLPLIVTEMRLLQRVIADVLQRNLIRMNLDTVVADMLEIGEATQEYLEFAVRSYQAQKTREAA
jgi:YesN/AraC family two-component response regulator